MAKCAVCDKGALFGRTISITRSQVSGRANKMWKSNIRSVRMNVGGNNQKMYLCASCLRTMRKVAAE